MHFIEHDETERGQLVRLSKEHIAQDFRRHHDNGRRAVD